MRNGIGKWIPGLLAAAVVVGVLTWMIADSPAPRPEPAAAVEPIPAPQQKLDPAAFDPPSYPGNTPAVPATVEEPLFAEAMTYYLAHDYSRASFALQKATGKHPENPEIRFYLGVSYLLTDDTQAGIRELKVAERLGDSPYMDRSQFYLAKAFLRQNDKVNALRLLDAVAGSGGSLAEPAKKLKAELLPPVTE
ncbi:MAG: tetratricopeptide repeat protein [Bryobacteraceae bacterium]